MHVILGNNTDNRRTLPEAMAALRDADMRVQQHRQAHGQPHVGGAGAPAQHRSRSRRPANAVASLQLHPRQAVAAFFQALGAFMAQHRVNLRVCGGRAGGSTSNARCQCCGIVVTAGLQICA